MSEGLSYPMPQVCLVSLPHEISMQTYDDCEESLMAAATQSGILYLVIDMSDVPYIASSGAGLLINVRDELRARKADLALINLQPQVRAPLEMLGLIAPSDDSLVEHRARADYIRVAESLDSLVSASA